MQTGIPPKGQDAKTIDLFRNSPGRVLDFIPYMSGLYTQGNSTTDVIKVGDTSYHSGYSSASPKAFHEGELLPLKIAVYQIEAEVRIQGTVYTTISLIVHMRIHSVQIRDESVTAQPGLYFYFSLEYNNCGSTMYTNEPPLFFAALDNEANVTQVRLIGYDYIQVPLSMEYLNPIAEKEGNTTPQERTQNGMINMATEQGEGQLLEKQGSSSGLRRMFKRLKDRRKEM